MVQIKNTLGTHRVETIVEMLAVVAFRGNRRQVNAMERKRIRANRINYTFMPARQVEFGGIEMRNNGRWEFSKRTKNYDRRHEGYKTNLQNAGNTRDVQQSNYATTPNTVTYRTGFHRAFLFTFRRRTCVRLFGYDWARVGERSSNGNNMGALL